MKIDVLLKKFIYNYLGLVISRKNSFTSHDFQLAKILNDRKIDCVFDVGANSGQYGEKLRENGYLGQIISFEPLSSVYQQLNNVASADPDWKVYRRCAVGSSLMNVDINIAKNSTSSSILKMGNKHIDAAPYSSYFDSENVEVLTLDSIYKAVDLKNTNRFLKIDTQGYEWDVLMGAKECISKFVGIQIELSLVELYESQKLWIEIHEYLTDKNFELWAVQPGFIDHRDGRTLQFDGIYINKCR